MTDHQGPPTLSLALRSVLCAAVEADERGALLSLLRHADTDADASPADPSAEPDITAEPDGEGVRPPDRLLAFPSPRKPSDDRCVPVGGPAGPATRAGLTVVAGVRGLRHGGQVGPDDEGPDAA